MPFIASSITNPSMRAVAVADFSTMDACVTHFAAQTPKAPAAIDGDVRWTFQELEGRTDALAQYLVTKGCARGDRIAVVAAPGLIYYTALMAISRIGAIYVGVNPRYTVAEAGHVLTLTAPALVIVDGRAGETVDQKIAEAAPNLPRSLFDDPQALPDQQSFEKSGVASASDVAVIVFTSGSTGRPKGAALHHGGLIAAARAQSNLSDVWPDGAKPRYLSNLPVNHVGGIMNLTLAALVRGGALVFQSKFDPGETLALLKREGITSWLQVPAIFTLCVQHPSFEELELPALRTIGIGGGPVSARALEALRRLGADIFVEYGQTETMSSLTWSEKTDPDEVLLNTVGHFDPDIEARIADEQGQPVARGEVGEVQARGNCVLRGYWGDEQATANAFTSDGWLHTGDLARFRPDGRVVLVGRAREMIKTGGYNVYPREVEQVLETHPAVAEVVVFGVADEIYVERVEAAIELASGLAIPHASELEAMCRAVLAGYKLPKRFHLEEVLPRLPNGKIDRTGTKARFQ